MTEARAVAERIVGEIIGRHVADARRNDFIVFASKAIADFATTAHAAGRRDMREEAATAVEDATRAPPQRNAKDQWIEQIGQRAAAAVRALDEG